MSDVVKRELVPVLSNDGWEDTAAEAEARVIRGSLLKFSEGRWFTGTENELVKEHRQFVAVATAAAWVKWQGGKPVEYRLREPGLPMPERDELGIANGQVGRAARTGSCGIPGRAPASCT